MTHCIGYAAAAVGPAARISTIGIDAEPDAPLPDGVLGLIATPIEQNRLGVMRPEPVDGRASTSSERMVTQQESDRPELGPVVVQRQRSRLQGLVPVGR